ncbi:MAG: hypothetical protein DRN83_03685 [Hadesarchaea archaeon]|nr:MAG: hypothetical protein DRN83_03685 [Hadesarchaea archaeon]
MRFKIQKFWRKEKKEVKKIEAPRPEKKQEREFPDISPAELRRNVGKHVAIVDGKIVAAAKGAKQTLTKAKDKYPSKKITLRYVANEKLLLKCGCLRK